MNSKIGKVYSWIVKNENCKKEKIEEILINSEKYPYLKNLIESAVEKPDLEHYVFYYFDNDFKNVSEDEKNSIIQKQNEKFIKFEEEIKNSHNIKNIKFIYVHETFSSLENVLSQNEFSNKKKQEVLKKMHELYSVFELRVLNAKQYNNKNNFLLESISPINFLVKKFNELKSFVDPKNAKNKDLIDSSNNILLARKIDTLKVLGSFYVHEQFKKNAFVSDFDIDVNYCNNIIDDIRKIKGNDKKSFLPKFEFIFEKLNKNNDISIVESLIYIPNNESKKIFLLFLENAKDFRERYNFCFCNFLSEFNKFLIRMEIKKSEKFTNFFKENNYSNIKDRFSNSIFCQFSDHTNKIFALIEDSKEPIDTKKIKASIDLINDEFKKKVRNRSFEEKVININGDESNLNDFPEDLLFLFNQSFSYRAKNNKLNKKEDLHLLVSEKFIDLFIKFVISNEIYKKNYNPDLYFEKAEVNQAYRVDSNEQKEIKNIFDQIKQLSEVIEINKDQRTENLDFSSSKIINFNLARN